MTGGASGSGNHTISYSTSSNNGGAHPQRVDHGRREDLHRHAVRVVQVRPGPLVHLHPGSAAIATLDVPPATVAGEVDERPRANLHDPDCVTVKIFPPAVIDALRVAPPLFELVE